MPHTIMRTRTATMMCHNMLHNNNTLYIYLHTVLVLVACTHDSHTRLTHTRLASRACMFCGGGGGVRLAPFRALIYDFRRPDNWHNTIRRAPRTNNRRAHTHTKHAHMMCACLCVCVSCCEAAVRGGRVEIRVRWLLLLQEQRHIAGTHLPTMFVLYKNTNGALCYI